jgi:hypothetical protein
MVEWLLDAAAIGVARARTVLLMAEPLWLGNLTIRSRSDISLRVSIC